MSCFQDGLLLESTGGLVLESAEGLKDVDLQIRPIHHRLEDRVRAHVFLCMLAYHVEWHLRQAWEPLMLTEPSIQSKAHSGKKATGRTDEGLVVCRYRDLLHELAGFTRNTMCFDHAPSVRVPFHPTPSPLQQRAFDLLSIKPIGL